MVKSNNKMPSEVSIITAKSKLPTEVGCFNVRRLRVEAGIDPEISDVTV